MHGGNALRTTEVQIPLSRRMDAVAVLYRVAALVAAVDSQGERCGWTTTATVPTTC